MSAQCTAEQMAKRAGVNVKTFRAKLRKQHFPWHKRYDRWTVDCDGSYYQAMMRVLKTLSS